MYGFLICKQLCAKTKWQRERVNVEPGNLKIYFKTKENVRLLYFTFNEWFHLSLLSASSGTGFPLSGQPLDADTRAEVTCQAEGGRRTLKGSGRLTLWAKKIKGKRNKTRETEMHFLSPAFTSSQMSSNRWLHPIGKMAPGQPICRFISYMPKKDMCRKKLQCMRLASHLVSIICNFFLFI